MEITYHGISAIRLRGKDCTVLVDPALPTTVNKLKPDLVVRSEGDTQPESLRPHEGKPQEIAGPGEFEVKGVSVRGMPAGRTTIMRIEVDDVRVATLGKLDRQLTEEEIEELGRIDVLVVPVGGVDALGATAATKLVNAIEPAIVVPVRYQTEGGDGQNFEPLGKFTKEMGLADGSWSVQPKLSLTGAMGATEETRVVILESRN